MEQKAVKEKLYEKYIAPTKKKRPGYIGVEIEIPILNIKKEAVDFDIVHQVTDAFIKHYSFSIAGRDDDGNIYMAQDTETGDILSYDCSYNNLELSMGRERNLFSIQKRFQSYYEFLQNEFHRYHYALTGMGVNPYRNYNYNIPIPNGRYRMLLHHLQSYKKYDISKYFHSYPNYGLFSSASQVQLDVKYEDLILTIQAFSKLEPLKALLFSNSVLLGEREDLQCCRDMFWEDSTHGINLHNVGMFDKEPENVEELQAYIESTSIYCVERGTKYINFAPVPIMEYFCHEHITGEYYDEKEKQYKTITIEPQLSDINYLRTFKFEDLTFRGTIEFRSVCCQPMRDNMVVAAFHVGLKERVHELNKLLSEDTVIYHHGYSATELRKLFNKVELPFFVERDGLYALAENVVRLAEEGLVARGYGEEVLLRPLYERIQNRTNPSQYLLANKDKLEMVIEEFGRLA